MAYVENCNANAQFQCSDTQKNIFLIGDSIRQGYCATVKEKLSSKAQVFYVGDKCRNTQYVITNLKTWANMFSNPNMVDIVHFNCGHWDVAHWCGGELPLTSEQEYKRNIKIIIDMIKKLFPNAKIIFATTTAMNPNGTIGINPRTTAQIANYNDIACDVAGENGVLINDLFAITNNWESDCYADYCHFTPKAFESLGMIVAETLNL